MAPSLRCEQAVLPGLKLSVWVLDGQGNPYPYYRDPHCFAVQPSKFSLRLHLEGTDGFKKQYNVCWDRLLAAIVYFDGTWVSSHVLFSLPVEETVSCKVLSIPGIGNVEHKLVLKKPESGSIDTVKESGVGGIKIEIKQWRLMTIDNTFRFEGVPRRLMNEGKEDKKFYKEQGVVFATGESLGRVHNWFWRTEDVEAGCNCALTVKYDVKGFMQLRGDVPREARPSAARDVEVIDLTGA